jgi:hypothetical protein
LVDASATASELYPSVFQRSVVGYNHSSRFKNPKSITAFDVPTTQKRKNCQISAFLIFFSISLFTISNLNNFCGMVLSAFLLLITDDTRKLFGFGWEMDFLLSSFQRVR